MCVCVAREAVVYCYKVPRRRHVVCVLKLTGVLNVSLVGCGAFLLLVSIGHTGPPTRGAISRPFVLGNVTVVMMLEELR